MAVRSIILSAACVTLTVAVWCAEAASIRNVYFSNGVMVEGQIIKSEGQLPGPTKTFEAGKDRVARLFIIFGDLAAHTLRGELTGPDGAAAKRLDRQISSLTRPDISWRYVWHTFDLQGLAPGEYSIDLLVDDAKTGTYTFTLK